METLTLKQFADMLLSLTSTDENIGSLSVPIDFQDTSADTLAIENEYQKYLEENQFEQAVNFRKANPVLESRILDAFKLNYLQALMLAAFQFAKHEKSALNTLYDNSESGLVSKNVQDATDEIVEKIKNIKIETVDPMSANTEGLIADALKTKNKFNTTDESIKTINNNINQTNINVDKCVKKANFSLSGNILNITI